MALDPAGVAKLATLFAALPDGLFAQIESALTHAAHAGAAAAPVRRLLDEEQQDRQRRDFVFAPLRPLFQAAADGCDPAAAWRPPLDPTSDMWRGLRRSDGGLVESLRVAALTGDTDAAIRAADALVAAAAVRLAEDPEWGPLSRRLSAATVDGPSRVAVALRIAPLARRAVPHADTVLRASSPEAAAALRLAFRDATARNAEDGVALLAALATRADEPWLVLRLVSAVVDRPSERFLAASEFAPFGEAVLTDVQARLARVEAFRGDTGAEGGAAAAAAVRSCATALNALEDAVALQTDGPIGRRVTRLRSELASTVERRIKEAVTATLQVLPTRPPRPATRLAGAPRYDAPVDDAAAARALGLLAFLEASRGAAEAGGFSAARREALAFLDARLDLHIEDVLADLQLPDPPAPAEMRERLRLAADLMGFVRDPAAAKLVRRRAAAL